MSSWTEDDTKSYQSISRVAVPARAEQIAVLLTLVPFDPAEAFGAIEIGCGEGILAEAMLEAFPKASMIAFDGSAAMRAEASSRLARFGGRAAVETFSLHSHAWTDRVTGAGVMLSSLCLHHLSGDQKRALFATVCEKLDPRGGFLIADLVAPQRSEAAEVFAATWDEAAQEQSQAATGADGLFRRFADMQWNYYRFPDPADTPSPLFDQLLWLREAGFATIDCFWLRAGHAIYGGYKSADDRGRTVGYHDALRCARRALGQPA